MARVNSSLSLKRQPSVALSPEQKAHSTFFLTPNSQEQPELIEMHRHALRLRQQKELELQQPEVLKMHRVNLSLKRDTQVDTKLDEQSSKVYRSLSRQFLRADSRQKINGSQQKVRGEVTKPHINSQ